MAALSLRLAARELRSGVRGFRIFLACLALGVAAIAAAGSTAEAFRHGLASQAREILGGDLFFSVENRDFTPAERAAFEKLGVTTYTAAARAMAQSAGGERRLRPTSPSPWPTTAAWPARRSSRPCWTACT
jgi:putative ABC transport system permease protein